MPHSCLKNGFSFQTIFCWLTHPPLVKKVSACTFFFPISLFEAVSDIWLLHFSEQGFSFMFTDLAVVAVSLSCICLFVTPRTVARQAFLFSTSSQSLRKLISTESVMPSSRLILCRPLLLPPSVLLSIRVFFSESALRIRWPMYWSFSLSSEYSGLISSGINWSDLLTVQRTVLLNSYLVIIFIFFITPVVLGCHHLLFFCDA